MNGWLAFALVVVAALAMAAGLVLVWARRNLLLVDVIGDSMVPAYHSGDQVLVRRVHAARVRAGDVVVADTSLITDEHLQRMAERRFGPGSDVRRSTVPATVAHREAEVSAEDAFKGGRMLKRVAAVPGDSLPGAVAAQAGETVVPPGRFVLLGDSPQDSLDSRFFGYVPATHVIGKVVRTISTAR